MEKNKGIQRIIKATGYSCNGLLWMLRNETAFKQEFVLTLVLFIWSFYLNVSIIEQTLMIVSLIFILLIETLNTAIEVVVDRIGLEKNALSGVAKDLGSAAVFISIGIAVIVWGVVLYR